MAADVSSPWLSAESRRKQQEVKRDAVMAVAAATFGAKGYKGTRIDDIATALNVTKPTIYYYFRTKDALFMACVDRAVDLMHERMEQVPEEASAIDQVKAFLRNYIEFMTDDIGRCLVIVSELDLGPKARKHLHGAKRDVHAILHAMIEAGMKQGVFTKRDANIVTVTIFGALNAVAHWHKPSERPSAKDVNATIGDLLVDGLRER